jgi:hypothetical protein
MDQVRPIRQGSSEARQGCPRSVRTGVGRPGLRHGCGLRPSRRETTPDSFGQRLAPSHVFRLSCPSRLGWGSGKLTSPDVLQANTEQLSRPR